MAVAKKYSIEYLRAEEERHRRIAQAKILQDVMKNIPVEDIVSAIKYAGGTAAEKVAQIEYRHRQFFLRRKEKLDAEIASILLTNRRPV